MKRAVRALVWRRANRCCEYCGLAQEDSPARTFHIDHIVARKHGGTDDPSNLALACDRCSLHKGADLTGIDPEAGEIVRMFHPRTQIWSDHFRQDAGHILGVSPTGRATVAVCQMNSPRRVILRIQLGR